MNKNLLKILLISYLMIPCVSCNNENSNTSIQVDNNYKLNYSISNEL